MSAPRAAILMPAYNAAAYVENTVRSILRQSFDDLLLIAVDDGSTDETPAILARLAAEDPRLRVLTAENGGPASARNLALDAVPAGTEYLMFSDADDEYAPDALRHALERGGGADLVLMGFSIRQSDGTARLYSEPEAHLTPETLGASLGRLYKANLLNQVWGKLFRASLILEGGLRFEDYRWGEDRLFLYDCLERAQSVAVLPESADTYIMHPGESLITRWNPTRLEVSVRADERMESLCRRFGVTDERDFRYMFMKNVRDYERTRARAQPRRLRRLRGALPVRGGAQRQRDAQRAGVPAGRLRRHRRPEALHRDQAPKVETIRNKKPPLRDEAEVFI